LPNFPYLTQAADMFTKLAHIVMCCLVKQ